MDKKVLLISALMILILVLLKVTSLGGIWMDDVDNKKKPQEESVSDENEDAGIVDEAEREPENTSISLGELEPYSQSGLVTTTSELKIDNYQKVHAEQGTVWCPIGDDSPQIEYYLGEEYDTLTGTLYVPYESRKTGNFEDYHEVSYIRIYGDEKLLYTGPSLSGKDKPVDFSVNVSGVEFLTIYMGGWFSESGRGLPKKYPVMCAGDLILSTGGNEQVSAEDLPICYLSEMEAYDWSSLDYQHDGFGNSYPYVGKAPYMGVIACSWASGYVEYYIGDKDCEYLTGTVYVPKCSMKPKDNYAKNPKEVTIYVDGKEVSKYKMKPGDTPITFKIDVSQAEFVKIRSEGGWFKGDGSGAIAVMCVSDLAIW